ncbi:hypothetical protein [Niabella beijingensis]|uniref:hypothetical protein n=1 Tax=Niabella beijingensis TaxID=2872700 RepID=UPI001CBCAA4C|nr:hypothetical protein [Niabella beijingensis]MBZ4192548.1 hypothetical protein [Niabella beijingensis]
MAKNKITTPCSDSCDNSDQPQIMACKLTSQEMQRRKMTVIERLKKQVIKKRALKNGYAYQFKGSDAVVDELTEFIKTERLCCDFFDFELKIAGNAAVAWLAITGPRGVKDFINTELGL